MIKIALIIALIIIVIALRNRIARFVTVTLVFISALFIALFLLDNFTTFNFRSYVPTAFYDDTVENPKDKAKEVKDKAYETGEGAIKRVKDMADETDYKYGTETKAQKEARLEKEDKKNDVEKSSDTNEEIVSNSEKKKPSSEKETKDDNNKRFVTYADLDEVLEKEYPTMLVGDIELAKTLVPNLELKFNGTEYKFWNDKSKKDGIYIEKIK